MFQILVGLVIKVMLDFSCVGIFIKNSNKAFIQIQMPTVTVLLTFLVEIACMLDTFLNYEEIGYTPVFGCVIAGLLYSYVIMMMLVLYTFKISRLYTLSNLKKTKQSDFLLKICHYISGMKDNMHWDNPRLLKKLKRQRILVLVSMVMIPGSLSFLVYSIILGQNLLSSTGVHECKYWGNALSVTIAGAILGFNILLVRNMVFRSDIFKIKRILQAVFVVVSVYSSCFIFGMIYEIVMRSVFTRVYINIANSLMILVSTIYPVYLSNQKIKSDLKIEEILRNKTLWTKFTLLCTDTLCSRYVDYIEQFRNLDQSKPLQIQKFVQKFFNPDSLYYLEEIPTWGFNLIEPDLY